MSARQPSPGTMSGALPSVTWHVVGQQSTTQYTPGGRFEQGINVTWQTDNGITGTTFIPQALYTLDNVLKAVARHVQEMARVHAATGTVTLG